MKRPEMFRRDRQEERLEAEIERDLQAVDAALAGAELHPDFDELGRLAVAIRDESPSIDDEFAAMLDERAAKGFLRPGLAPGARSAWSKVGERLEAVSPRRLIPVAGAMASLLIVSGVAVSVLRNGNSGSGTNSSFSAETATSSGSAAVDSSGGGSSGATSQAAKDQVPDLPGSPSPGSLSYRTTGKRFDRAAVPSLGRLSSPAAAAPAGRHVSQTANLTLSTDPDKVRNIAGAVTEIVTRYKGLVISSQITSGEGSPPTDGQPIPLPFEGGVLGAEFQLRIPAAGIESALNDLSGLGLVVSRTQGSQDITGRFVSAHDRIQSLTSERDQLIKQLSAPFITQDAIDAINARLRAVRSALTNAQGDLGNLKQRVSMVPVHLSVVAKGSGGGDDGFDLGDAAHDAGRVLTVGAGVALVSLAVIVPLGLIAGLIWLATSRARRRRREQALD